MSMTSDDIWTNLYDKGINGGLDSFSKTQKHLYFYIDFFYDVEMGGFLYNKSPSTPEKNNFLPYIDSWNFFKYNKLADLVQEYNDKYLKAFNVLKSGESMPTYEFNERFGLTEIAEQIESLINEVMDNNESIYDFIDKNKVELIRGL